MLNTKASICARLAALLLLGTLVSCGGGGGGGGDGGTAAGPVAYTGNTNAAVITTSNAAQLTATLLGSAGASAALLSASRAEEASGARDLARRLGSALRATPLPSASGGRRLTSEPFDTGVEPCESGSTRASGDISPAGTGTANITWSACRFGDTTLNGSASVTIDAFDLVNQVIINGTFSFQRLSVSDPLGSEDISGSIQLQTSVSSNSETLTADLVSVASNGRMTKTVKLEVVDAFNNLFVPTSYTERIRGRVFDGVHGFVDVDTNTAFVFGTLAQPFPSSGEIVLTGANKSQIRATAFSFQAVTLGLDLNGDGTFEMAASLAWTELAGPVGADLADTDGDGMHNSWEDAKGFNRLNPADALEDADLDGANNLAEYRAGTNPRDRTSTPANPPTPPAPPVPGLPEPIAAGVIELPGVKDLVYDSVTQRIYASVQGNPGSIVPIDPVTGVKGAAIVVGVNPGKLALSDDGQYLYVGLDGESAFQRVTLATRAVERFAVGPPRLPGCGELFVEDMQVLPGNPQSVAISRRNGGCSPRHEGVAIYDNGNPRAQITQTHTGSNVIEFSASAGILYGYNNETTEFGFRKLTVGAGGVVETTVFDSFEGNLIQGFGVDIRFGGGRIYTTTGLVIDPETPARLAAFGVPGFGNLVVPDAAINRVFFLSFDTTTSRWSLHAFDMTQIPPLTLGREDISNIVGNPRSLIRWGARGLAFRAGADAFATSGDRILLIESPVLIP